MISTEKLKTESTSEKLNIYIPIMRIQRIRAISLLIDTQLSPTRLNPLIKTALRDFQYLNKMSQSEKYHESAEYGYYLLGCIGPILNYATENNLIENNVVNNDEYPFMDLGIITNAIKFGSYKKTDPLQESVRKRNGLMTLMNFTIKHQPSQIKS